MSPRPRRDWITASEAAALLGVSRTQATRLATAGRVHAEDTGTLWLFWGPSVLEYKAAPPRVGGNKPGWLDRKRRRERRAS